MATPLQSASIAAPGFYGLNTQESGITLESGFALEATNCVIDKFGRLGARKGWGFVIEETGSNLAGMHRFIDVDGTVTDGFWSQNNSFYKRDDGSATLDSVTYSGTQTKITNNDEDGNWQAATLNDAAFLFQKNYRPIYFSPTTGVLDDVEAVANNHGEAAPSANCVLSAYGRLWAANTSEWTYSNTVQPANTTTVYWSDLLDGTKWDTGTAGSIDISSILVYGNDEIIGLGAHNGALIVFCRHNIIILGDSPVDGSATQVAGNYILDPTKLQLVEVISGVGCISRDSIVNTGTDIVFLSDSGLRSLGRVIQEKSQPMRELSRNIRDDLVQTISSETNPQGIKGVYSEKNAFYLLSFPTTGKIYCFDMRGPLQDGSSRVTTWTGLPFTSWVDTADGLYMTHADGLAEYRGYQDNNESYRMVYFTNYFDLGDASKTKILKRLALTVIGGKDQDFILKSGFDYENLYRSYSLQIETGTVYKFDTNKYGLTNAVTEVSQGANTVTFPDGTHHSFDFVTAENPPYEVPLNVWLDTDGYYYTSNTKELSITGITNANPPVVTTSTNHGLTTGDTVTITDVVGFEALDLTGAEIDRINQKYFTVTVLSDTTFSLDNVNAEVSQTGTFNSGWNTYTSGGTVTKSLGRTRTTLWTKVSAYDAKFTGAGQVENIRLAASGTGSVIQLGFEAELEGEALSVQKIDVYVKQGRVI